MSVKFEHKNQESEPGPRFLFVTLVRCLIWSGINIGLLLLIRFLDHNFLVSETMLSVMLIPVGLINCAVLVYGFYNLRHFNRNNLLISIFTTGNFLLFVSILNNLYSQAGPILN